MSRTVDGVCVVIKSHSELSQKFDLIMVQTKLTKSKETPAAISSINVASSPLLLVQTKTEIDYFLQTLSVLDQLSFSSVTH